jgi:hypothetical protein
MILLNERIQSIRSSFHETSMYEADLLASFLIDYGLVVFCSPHWNSFQVFVRGYPYRYRTPYHSHRLKSKADFSLPLLQTEEVLKVVESS